MGIPVNKGNDVMVQSNGNVRWLAPLVFKSACKLNVRYFPFDEQFCALEFASWTRGDLSLFPGKRKVLKNYTGIFDNGVCTMIITIAVLVFEFLSESSEWILRGVLVGRISINDRYHGNRSGVIYVINIKRQVFYYFLYLITPCMLVSLLTIILFVLPPESGELMVVGVTMLLSLTVFFLLASTHLPETSEVVPLIGR